MSLDQRIENAKQVLDRSIDKNYLSDFWKTILEGRPNFPPKSELVRFFQIGGATGYGTIKGESPEKRYKHLVKTFLQDVPKSFFERFLEPETGVPEKFSYRGLNFSITYLQNIPTTYRIQKLPLGKRLRVLEIGAGYGAVANQLFQILDIEKYTIVDLPESLYISYFYLSESTKEKSTFAVQEKISQGIEFATPDQLHLIDDEYDLVINTISFGEMELKMVREYVDFIQKSLSPEGYFYSLNTHGKAGVVKPSQYLMEQGSLFSVYHWIRRVPNALFNRLHYELAQTKTSGIKIDDQLKLEVDRIGRLILLGVTIPESPSTAHYVKGLTHFAAGENTEARQSLAQAQKLGLSGFAKILASIILCLTDRRMRFYGGKSRLYRLLNAEAPVLKKEVAELLRIPPLKDFFKYSGPRQLEKRIKALIKAELQLN